MSKVVKKLFRYFEFINEYFTLKKQLRKSQQRFMLRWNDRYPCLKDKTNTTQFDRHYIYHPAWAARILAQINPNSHVDISSTLHFCVLVSAFIPVKFYDYRPAELKLSNLCSASVDLLNLPFDDKSLMSISCMHVVEHIGLGRYGDTVDIDGDLKSISELKRVLAIGGTLLLVVPIGKSKIAFNAHRIYSYDQIVSYFAELELKEFALIPDHEIDGGLIQNATREQADAQEYGCGCFWFQRNNSIESEEVCT